LHVSSDRQLQPEIAIEAGAVRRYDCGEALAYTAMDKSISEYGEKGKQL
jgi:hypothetical protein